MELLDLPEEILIILIKFLDLRTLNALYNTCHKFRNMACMIKHWHMTANVMATVNTLKLNFFRDMSHNLHTLNMCKVPDLCPRDVVSALQMLKSLRSIDVAFTQINILDLVAIPDICPTIRDFSINFVFGKSILTPEELLQCQRLFKQFDNIHFVGTQINLLGKKIVVYLLKDSRLNTLKYSIICCNLYHVVCHNEDCDVFPQLNHFGIYYLEPKEVYIDLLFYEAPKNSDQTPVLSMLDFKKYEILVIDFSSFIVKIYATKLFNEFFYEQFGLIAQSFTEFKNFTRCPAILLWNKDTTIFDDVFFHKLATHLIQFLPHRFQWPCDSPAPINYDWFFTIPTGDEELEAAANSSFNTCKKMKTTPSNVLLDYSEMFKAKRNIELSVFFKSNLKGTIELSPNSDYLKKITYMSLLTGIGVQYEYIPEFFEILFRCCDNLVTFNFENPKTTTTNILVTPQISRAVHLSRILKNIRIVECTINFVPLFLSFSQCKTIENIHIVDLNQRVFNQVADPAILLENCDSFYSLYIRALVSIKNIRQSQRTFNNAKELLKKPYAHIAFANNTNSQYNPFKNVFKVTPIKPLIV